MVGRGAGKLLIGSALIALVGSGGVALASFTGATSAAMTVSTASLAAPTSLSVSGSAILTWTATTSAFASGTRVYRATVSGGPFSQIAQIAGLATATYTDSPGAGVFYYVVAAYYSGNAANWTSANSNQAQTAGCSAPGTATVTSDADAYVDSSAAATNYGSVTSLNIDSNPGKFKESFLHFPLPAARAGCTITSTTVSMNQTGALKAGHFLGVTNAASGWTESTLTYSNKPATTGATTSLAQAVGTMTFTITTQVQAQYAGTNNGLVVQDTTSPQANGGSVIASRESGTPETLSVTFG